MDNTPAFNAAYGGGVTTQAGGTPSELGGGGVDPATGNLRTLAATLAGAQKPWPMAGYGQGLEMNPYQENGYNRYQGPNRFVNQGGGGSQGSQIAPGYMLDPATHLVVPDPNYKPPDYTAGYNFGGGQPGGVTAGPPMGNVGGGGMIPGSKYPPGTVDPGFGMWPGMGNFGMGYGGRPYNVGGGGKPSIGSQYGGGKPRIGYGGGFNPNTRAQMW